jgi:hypothetical protein
VLHQAEMEDRLDAADVDADGMLEAFLGTLEVSLVAVGQTLGVVEGREAAVFRQPRRQLDGHVVVGMRRLVVLHVAVDRASVEVRSRVFGIQLDGLVEVLQRLVLVLVAQMLQGKTSVDVERGSLGIDLYGLVVLLHGLVRLLATFSNWPFSWYEKPNSLWACACFRFDTDDFDSLPTAVSRSSIDSLYLTSSRRHLPLSR